MRNSRKDLGVDIKPCGEDGNQNRCHNADDPCNNQAKDASCHGTTRIALRHFTRRATCTGTPLADRRGIFYDTECRTNKGKKISNTAEHKGSKHPLPAPERTCQGRLGEVENPQTEYVVEYKVPAEPGEKWSSIELFTSSKAKPSNTENGHHDQRTDECQ